MVGMVQSEEIQNSSEDASHAAKIEKRKIVRTMPWIVSAILPATFMGWYRWKYGLTYLNNVEELIPLSNLFPNLVYNKDMQRP